MMCDEGYDIDSRKSRLSAFETRSCLFTDYSLCYAFDQDARSESSDAEWIYYSDIFPFGYDENGSLLSYRLPFRVTKAVKLNFASHTIKSPEHSIESMRDAVFNFTIKQLPTEYSNSTLYIDEWTIHGMDTEHGNNIGHILFDTYLKIYMAVDNFMPDGVGHNSTINVIKLPRTMGAPIREKFTTAFERILFGSVNFLDDVIESSAKQGYNQVCFKNIVVGTTEKSGLFDAIHANNRLLKTFRKRILNGLKLDDLHKPDRINILMLHKTMSYWGRNETITNYIDIQQEMINKYSHCCNVTLLDPSSTGVAEGIQILHDSSIVISPVGGIGFTNFLQPLYGVQIYLIRWGLVDDYSLKKHPETFIPENDHEVHNQQALHTILKYADLSSKHNHSQHNKSWSIKKDAFYLVLDKAIQIVEKRFF
eukprot:CAMPEP_0202728170 /NCGR_PEP_ID=MMETSP1385-20130828/185492_1 /ASSEMBLY_ACC=CAM_ASM_000861 /TAXON_ID=933848 /ORGANISM="Elphidium margaritaceum" /LENGTH=421 /DNA_ID=CAMNT_0049394417 /DNA_START=467 /DNA_END=1732 /DNA_ORIENTATION=-